MLDSPSCALQDQESPYSDRAAVDHPALFSLSYAPHAEEPPLPHGKTLATLRIFLMQARQTVASDPAGARRCVERALALLNSDGARPEADHGSTLYAGGLASWQMQRVRAMIEAQLGQRLLITELASAVRLSPSHFARAFKRSAGCSPHHYMLKRRIERAKEQMRAGADSLAQIALACGFSDQSHFTRCFKRCEGETPTAWQRRGEGIGPDGDRTALLAAI